jgi:hypothetical protein
MTIPLCIPPRETATEYLERRVHEEDEPLDIEEVRRQLGLRLPVIKDEAHE